MKKALFFKKLRDKKAQCQNCAHFCLLEEGNWGKCGVRKNIKGDIYLLNYQKIVALNVDPIEKKPLFHFLPGSKTFSIASSGCPFRCKNCQNFEISQNLKEKENSGKIVKASEIVKKAKQSGCSSISYTYTDPIVSLEHFLEIMKLAKKKDLKNVWVSSGFFSPFSLKATLPYLDAINIDLKSFSDSFYREICSSSIKPVLDSIKKIKKSNVWLEVTTLVIPTLNDSEEEIRSIARFLAKIDKDIPWHISRFFSSISYNLRDLPDTPKETIDIAYQIGKEEGLNYVYTGNVFDSSKEDTYCKKCSTLLIDRTGYLVNRYDKEGRCRKCNFLNKFVLK